MYMKLFMKLYGVKPNGLVHVGAHLAEEYQEYERSGILGSGKCIWVEPQPDKAAQLRKLFEESPKHEVIEALAWSQSGLNLTLKVTNRSASSSVFEMDEHRELYPTIEVTNEIELKSVRLEDVLPKDSSFNFLVLDVQGAELEVLLGLGFLLGQVNWIYTEVSRKNLYSEGVLYPELNEFLEREGFKRRFVEWDRRAGWGNALYIRDEAWKDSFWLKIRRFINWIYRRIYGRIPQFLFPTLVSVKSRVVNWL